LRQAELARGPRADVQLLSGDDDAQEQLRLRDRQPARDRLDQAGDEAGRREAHGLDRGLEGLAAPEAPEARTGGPGVPPPTPLATTPSAIADAPRVPP